MVIKYFADIRALTHCDEQRWTRSACDLRQLLAGLAREHGVPFESRVFPGGELGTALIILVDGLRIEHRRGLDTPLDQNSTVAIFPMVAGG